MMITAPFRIGRHYPMEGYRGTVKQCLWMGAYWYVVLDGGVIAVAAHALEKDTGIEEDRNESFS